MLGEIAALGAAISWAVAHILYRKALANASPVSANIVRCVTSAAVIVVILAGLGLTGTLASLPVQVIAVVVVSGIIGLGVGDTLYMGGLKSVGVARAVPLAATYPLFSLLGATLPLGEPGTAAGVAG